MKQENQRTTFLNRASIIWITSLVAADQIIKLLIARFLIDAHFTIIPHVFTFQTTQNIHLGWIWNMLDFMMPLHFAIIISVVAIFVMIIIHRYLVFLTLKWEKYHSLPTISLVLVLSTGFCKLIDDIFWGGSLDYIQLFDWFIFDLKDVYGTVAVLVMLYFSITLEVYSRKLPKEKRKELRLLNWIKLGFPTRH